ncbi:MAG TPA: hypothetical protein VIW68_12580 [Candidatus Sulfotelmatobacter sp.]
MPKLEQALVTRYAKLNALKNAIGKWLEEKRSIILEALQGGAKCPVRGPYLIELNEAKAPIAWKEEFRGYLMDNGKTDVQAEAILKEISDRERGIVARLECKANPSYGRTVEIRIPGVR